MQSSINRDAEDIVSDPDSGLHSFNLCVWQEGAYALLEQYKDLASRLPKSNNLEVSVLTKKELMKKFRVKDEAIETTFQINAICENASQMMPEVETHIFIDECWVTVPKKLTAHLTTVSCSVYQHKSSIFNLQANPNEVVGHIPFVKGHVLYPWSKLNQWSVKLSVAVMPDCQNLLEKDLITAPPPPQGSVLTAFAPKSFR